MNEPLKHKLFSVYGQLLNEKILKEAWLHVKKNKGCEGIDKVSIKKFDQNQEEYLSEMLLKLKNKEYKPSPVARKYIPKKNGKLRPLGIPTITDRIIQQALVMKLTRLFEEEVFHDNSCGFRPKRDSQLVLTKIIDRIENNYHYIYDFDIKGYFDTIPHKKLMKVINKYVSDGTVLDMIWKWLKAGYMEDGIKYETPQGLMQGGVISPLLANVYLNELDWEMDKAGYQFIRYADDGIVMCKSKEDLEEAKQLVHKVLTQLGLEIAEEKTKDVDFHDDDFDFLGFTFKHLRRSKKGNIYYILAVSEKSVRKHKSDVKGLTKKQYTFSYEKWKELLNPVLSGKYNYYLKAIKANKIIQEAYQKQGKESHCIVNESIYRELDGYVRNRLRVAFANRGKKTARYNEGKILTVKYPNRFFVEVMELVTGTLLLARECNPEITIEEHLNEIKKKIVKGPSKKEFFKWAYAR
jgi:group II intron reverse transcriptase/maturase